MRVVIKYVYIYCFINYLKFTSRHYSSRFHLSHYRLFHYHLSYFRLTHFNNLNISLLKISFIIVISFFQLSKVFTSRCHTRALFFFIKDFKNLM